MSDPQNNRDGLKEVLEEIVLGQIKKLHKSAELTGENFNVFDILNNEKTHSAIIAELLNPQGSHNQGTSFLKLFLEELLKEEIPNLKCGKNDLSDEYLKKFEVRVEVSFDRENKNGESEKSRIDILIEKDDNWIVIENKIWADDQPRQLERYHEYATSKSKDPILIYLTRYGTEPGGNTLGCLPKDTVVCLSYRDFIVKWLDNCIKEVARIPQIRETLHQYQMTVRKLTGRIPSEVEDILNKEILGKDYKKLKGEIIEGVQHKLQCKFWKELKKRLIEEQLADQNSKFQLYISVNNNTEISEDDLKDHIGDNFLGLTFSIPNGSIDGQHEVAFRVDYQKTISNDFFNYGFVFCKKDTLQRVKIEQKYEEIVKPYVIAEEHQSLGDGWISWKYLQYKHELVSFIMESKETLIRKLVSEINLALAFVETRKNNNE